MKKILLPALILCLLLSLAACGQKQAAPEPEKAPPAAPDAAENPEKTPEARPAEPEVKPELPPEEPEKEPEIQPEEEPEIEPEEPEAGPEEPEEQNQLGSGEKSEVSGELPESLAKAWLLGDRGRGLNLYFTLFEDGTAQLVVQTDIGDLLELSFGHWSQPGEGRLRLEMTDDPTGSEDGRGSWGGEYLVTTDGIRLTLEGTGGADELSREREGENRTTFFLGDRIPEGRPILDPLHDSRITGAALCCYMERNGGCEPGNIVAESFGPEGVSVHLYDVVDDHTATCAWYLIDPDTLLGSDGITGEEIDFLPYAEMLY